MKTQTHPPDRGEFRRVAEGLYQYETSGAYYARFRFKGERIFERLGTDRTPCTSLPEAKRLLRDLKDRTERTDVASARKTIHAIIKEYQDVMSFGADTQKYKKQYLEELKDFFTSTQKVRDIKTSDVRLFLKQYDERLAPATINKVITLTRDVFQYAIDDQVIAVSPAAGIKYKDLKTTSKRLTPSWEEFTAIVESIREQKYADTAKDSGDLIEFMGLAGLGQGECSGLRWCDINFQTGIITIIRKKTGYEFPIPIYPMVRVLLERMDGERGKDRTPTADVFKVKNPKKALEAACNRLELPDYTARAFRRMFITRCIELGIDVQSIAKWQGHRDGGVLILKTYGSVGQKHQDEMARRLVAHSEANNTIQITAAA